MDTELTQLPASIQRPIIHRVPGLKLTAAQEALLQRAFADCVEVLVEQEFHSRYSGASVYLVTRAEQAPVIIKIAHPFDIQREYTAYRELVEKSAPQHTMRLVGDMLTSDDGQLASLTYTFVGGDADQPTTSLGDYYHKHGGAAAAEVLNRIFRVYGRLWWLNNQLDRRVTGEEYDRLLPAHLQLAVVNHTDSDPQLLHGGDVDLPTLRTLRAGQYVLLRGFEITQAQPGLLFLRAGAPLGERAAPLRFRLEGNLATAYQFGDILEPQLAVITATREMVLAEAIRAVVPGFHEREADFTFQGITYGNPLPEVNRLLDVTYDARVSIIQGDLNLQNVLVDPATSFAWLIDFAETRRGPALFDLQYLEVQVITRILPAALGRARLEPKALVSLLEALNSHYLTPTAPLPALQEPYTLLVAIRRLARQFLVLDQEWEEYYRGVILGLLGALKVPEVDASARLLAVISAATLLRLSHTPLAEPMTAAAPTVLPTQPASLAPGAARGQEPAPGGSPFKGLQHFDSADADLFYGRETLTAELVAYLRERRFLAIVGASGSGKSSLARAGVIPALQRGQPLIDGSLPPAGSANWPLYLLTPTEAPLKALAATLTKESESMTVTARLLDDLARDSRSLDLYIFRLLRDQSGSTAKDRRLLLVIDQFEELFTLCHDRQQRKAFVDNLLTAAAGGQTVIILTLRADFYAHCAEFENLRRALENQQKYIGPMNREELRRAIEEPARRNQWHFEAGLVDLLLKDVGDEPGALPLLSHALLETWNRRQGRTLTHAGYAAAGRVQGAIAQTAEKVYNHELKAEQRPIARNIFLRLTELGEGAQDTRRRVPLAELVPQSAQAKSVETVLNILSDARLVTMFAGSVEVAHEALIREWPRLREWLADDREGLRVHRRLTEAAQEWKALQQDPDALLRGIRLDQAVAWAAQNGSDMNALERAFLEASREEAEKAVRTRELSRRRELEQAQALAREQRQRALEQQQRAQEQQKRAEEQALAASRLRRRAIYLAGALAIAVLAVISTGWLFQTAQRARLQEVVARATAVAGQQEAIEAGKVAESNRLLAEQEAQRADQNAARSEAEALKAQEQAQIARAGRLAAQAQMVTQNQPARASSLSLLLAREAILTTWQADSTVITQAFVTDEADTALRFAVNNAPPWRMTMPRYHHTAAINAVAYSPDGSLLVTASGDATANLWEAATGKHLHQLLGHRDGIAAAAFSPDGQTVVTGGGDRSARLWNVADGSEIRRFDGHTAGVNSVAFSPDGQLILTASSDMTACLWEAATGTQTRCFTGGHSDVIYAAAFSPDQQLIATAGLDATICLWAVATGERQQCLQGHGAAIRTVLFHPDGKTLISAAWDGTARIWDITTGGEVGQVKHSNRFLNQVALSPDSQSLLTGHRSGVACLWDLATAEEIRCYEGNHSGVLTLAFNPDGQSFATGSGNDRAVRLWQIEDGAEILAMGGHTDRITQSVFSPDGSTIATVSLDGTLHLWDATTGELIYWIRAHNQPIHGVAFSPDGNLLATVSADQTGRLWNAKSGEAVRGLAGHADSVNAVAFSPNGELLLTASADNSILLWNVATGKRIQRLDGHTAAVTAASFSPNGQLIVSGGVDQTVRLWEIVIGEEIRRFEGHSGDITALAFRPDGVQLLSASADQTVRLWNVADGEELYRFDDDRTTTWALAFSPDGQTFATANEDLTARLWQVATQARLLALDGHSAAVTSVAFSPDGQSLLTASADKSIRLWGAATWGQRHTFVGHSDDVNEAVFSPDGKTLFTTSDDLTIRVWDVATAQPLRQMNGHQSPVVAVVFSPDGKLAVTASADHTARLWDPTTGNQLRHLEGHTAPLTSAAFSPDGKLVVTASADRTARIWQTTTATEIRRLAGHTDQVNGALFSPDGKMVVTISRDQSIRVWDAEDGAEIQTLAGHTGEVKAVAFSPDGTTIVTAGADRTARVWDLTAGQQVYPIAGPTEGIDIVAFSPDGQSILTAGGDQVIHLWERTSGRELRAFNRPAPFLSVTFSPDGKALLITGEDPIVVLLDLASGNETPYETGHDGAINAAAFTPNGQQVLTAGNDLTSRLWNLSDGAEVHRLSGHTDTVNVIMCSPDGRTLLTGSDDFTARLWDVATGAQIGQLNDHEDDVESVAFSPDGKTLATTSDDLIVRLWDATTGELLHRLEGHENDLNWVAFSPDSQWIVSASHDQTARLWKVATGEPGHILHGDNKEVDVAVFSPDGRFIASTSRSRTIYLWDAATGQQIRAMTGHADTIFKLAFSPDSTMLATASGDNTARLWEVATGRTLRILEGHTEPLTSISFSPDGKAVVTASLDDQARIWPVYVEDLMGVAQALIQRSPAMFTGEERRRYNLE